MHCMRARDWPMHLHTCVTVPLSADCPWPEHDRRSSGRVCQRLQPAGVPAPAAAAGPGEARGGKLTGIEWASLGSCQVPYIGAAFAGGMQQAAVGVALGVFAVQGTHQCCARLTSLGPTPCALLWRFSGASVHQARVATN